MLLSPGARVHLIGVCGTAMGSLAGMLRERGYRVTGSDAHVYPPMSDLLRQMGIALSEGFAAANLDQCDLVVVGNAVSRGNPELEAALERRLPYLSLPEVLRELFLRGRCPVVITGTHGKTTTTALTAFLLERGGLDPSFLIAGAPRNWERSYRLGDGEHFVIEGDEYDTAYWLKIAKFFFYLPEVLVVNNIEFDHADIFRDLFEIERAFRQLLNTVPRHGLIIANAEDPVVRPLLDGAPAPVLTFGLGPQVDLAGLRLEADASGTRFDAELRGAPLGRFHVPLHGQHNVRNALAALAVGLRAGLSAETLRQALPGFLGVHRRQEELASIGGVRLVDDFAHHPTAVRATLEALRAAHPQARLRVLFEPASATNARALFEEQYVGAFALADEVIVGRVPRPERARQDPPFDPRRLVEGIRRAGRQAEHLPEADAIATHVAASARPGDIVVLMSNGAFGGLSRRLQQLLSERIAAPPEPARPEPVPPAAA